MTALPAPCRFLLACILAATGLGAREAPGGGLDRHRAVLSALLERRDPGAALGLLEGAEAETDPGLLYLKAIALARLGRREEALALAVRLEALDPGFHAATDPEFAALRPGPRPGRPVGALRVISRLALPDLFPEGLAVDPRTGRTFLSSLVRGGVYMLEPDGRARWFLKARRKGPWETLGLKVDAKRRLLWIASREPAGAAGGGRRCALFAADLDSGRVVRRVSLPRGGKHLLNDLALGTEGTVFVTDSEAGAVYRVPAGTDRFETVLPAGSLPYPNGLVMARDGGALLVAAGGPGLYRVDLADGALRELKLPPGQHLQGIDGLTRVGARLVAVQNGIHPGRVVAVELDPAETEVRGVTVLAAGQPELEGIPTTGDAAGTGFRFIANSQIPLLRERGRPTGAAPFLVAEVALPADLTASR